ncbi:MAG: 3-hydroxy-3-methylglutaryl-CoA reductase, partial [Candidatus Bathyarchaeia archaeon]
MAKSSECHGFYKLGIAERLEFLKGFSGLTDEEAGLLRKEGGLSLDRAERKIENVVGFMPIPLGIAVNFLINGKDYLIPMAIEEPSVVAAASNAARMARPSGGFGPAA